MPYLLNSYMRTYRMKGGLVLKDIAFLLSLKSSGTISRMEKGLRPPTVLVLLAYCILFNVSCEEVIPGIVRDTKTLIIKRAPLLVKILEKQETTPMITQRIKFLKGLYTNKECLHSNLNEGI